MTFPEPFRKHPANTFALLLHALSCVWRMLTGDEAGQSLSRIRNLIQKAETSLRKVLTELAGTHSRSRDPKKPAVKKQRASNSGSAPRKKAAPAQSKTDAFGLTPLRPMPPENSKTPNTRTPGSKSNSAPRPKPSEAQQRDHLLARLCRLEDALRNPGAYVEAFAMHLKRESRPLKIEDLFEHSAADHIAFIERMMQQNVPAAPDDSDTS